MNLKLKPFLDSLDSHFKNNNADSYYLDSEDNCYCYPNNLPPTKEPIKPKQKLDRAGIAAIIYGFSIIGLVTGLTVYTAWQILFG